jgi:hypothetical protein
MSETRYFFKTHNEELKASLAALLARPQNQDDDQTQTDFSTWSATDIIDYFSAYDFRGLLGQPLCLCQEFIDLVHAVTSNNKA